MEQLIITTVVKFKVFWIWLLTGGVFQYFEFNVKGGRFNLGRFIIGCVIFGILTQFSYLLIQGGFVETDLANESRVLAISILLASFLYLFLPFILKEENRDRFIESTLEKFWFTKK